MKVGSSCQSQATCTNKAPKDTPDFGLRTGSNDNSVLGYRPTSARRSITTIRCLGITTFCSLSIACTHGTACTSFSLSSNKLCCRFHYVSAEAATCDQAGHCLSQADLQTLSLTLAKTYVAQTALPMSLPPRWDRTSIHSSSGNCSAVLHNCSLLLYMLGLLATQRTSGLKAPCIRFRQV